MKYDPGGSRTLSSKKTAMLALLSAVCLLAPLAECQYEYEEPLLYDTFPDGFMWGGNFSLSTFSTSSNHMSSPFLFQRPLLRSRFMQIHVNKVNLG